MDISVLLTGSLGILIIVFILYMMYRYRFNNRTPKKIKVASNKVTSWLTNGAYVGYYTT